MLCQAAGNRRQNHIIGKQADTHPVMWAA